MLIQKIERVNSMTIRKMANEELSQCVDVIRKSYETEAVAFGITEMNFESRPESKIQDS